MDADRITRLDTLETLSTRLPGLRLAPDQEVTMLPTMIHRSPAALSVTW